MNLASYIILAVIIAALVLAVRYSVTHHTSCADCGGSCSLSDKKSCSSSKKNSEDFRQQRLDDLWEKTQADIK